MNEFKFCIHGNIDLNIAYPLSLILENEILDDIQLAVTVSLMLSCIKDERVLMYF